jgi:hypothetical protein
MGHIQLGTYFRLVQAKWKLNKNVTSFHSGKAEIEKKNQREWESWFRA